MARMHHPNIVSFIGVAASSADIDAGNLHNLHDIVMEYMPSGNLGRALEKDQDFVRLPWRSRVLIALQVAQAMEYMHSLEVIHFDVTIHNVVLDLTNPMHALAKICDFGLASVKEEDMDFMHMLGHPGWVAPEVAYIDVSPITEKADIFSFGVLLHVLVTGREPLNMDVLTDEQINYKFFRNYGQHHSSVPEWSYLEWMELVRDCLNGLAPLRPGFSEVAARLSYMLDAVSGPMEREESSASNHSESVECSNLKVPAIDFITSDQCLPC